MSNFPIDLRDSKKRQDKTEQRGITLVDILWQRSQNQSDRPAYIFLQDGETESGSLTYGELDRQARAIASQLESYRGERALLLYPSGLEFISAFFGCMYAGVIAVPVYPPKRNQKLSRLLAIANDAQAKLALTTTSILPSIEKKRSLESNLTQLKLLATDTMEASSSDFTPQSLTPDSLAFLQYTSGSTGTPKGVMVAHGNLIHNSECIKQAFNLTPESVSVTWLPAFHDMGLIDGVLQPLYTGFIGYIMPPAAFLKKPIRWLQAISRYKATHCGGPNFAYDLCVRQVTSEQLKALDLSSWDTAYNGAEPVSDETLKSFVAKFQACGFKSNFFYPCYGMAEATLFICGGLRESTPIVKWLQAEALEENKIVDETPSSLGSKAIVGCGRRWLDFTIVIVQPESFQICGDGQVGEIWVSSASVAKGYWNRPQQTQETFEAYLTDGSDPFLRTGDLGFLSQGELFVTGRLKDLIIIRGRNHYPQDLELTIENSHPALRSHCSAAFSVEIAREERLVIACEVERTYLKTLDTEEVARKLRKAVSEEHNLQVYAVVLLKTGNIPKTSSGKIQRHACRTGFLNKSLDIVGESTIEVQDTESPHLQTALAMQSEQGEKGVTQQLVSVQTNPQEDLSTQKLVLTKVEIEAWLVSRVAHYLNVLPNEIDVNDSFFEYGLDSSVALSLTGELETWLNLELQPTLFWEHQNISELIQYLIETIENKSDETNI